MVVYVILQLVNVDVHLVGSVLTVVSLVTKDFMVRNVKKNVIVRMLMDVIISVEDVIVNLVGGEIVARKLV